MKGVWVAFALMLAGCQSPSYSVNAAWTPGRLISEAGVRDERAAFRAVFCTKAKLSAHDCDRYLWRFGDEAPFTYPQSSTHSLRVFLVGGLFSGCLGEASRPWVDSAAALASRGIAVTQVPVQGRSGAALNASIINRTVSQYRKQPDERWIMIAHSKGGVDGLTALWTYPELSREIDAMVTVASPLMGSELADLGAPLYASLFKDGFVERCAPGDGMAMRDLQPAIRRQALESHHLPAGVAYYAVGTLPDDNSLAYGLKPAAAMMAPHPNDGQVRLDHTWLKGFRLLGLMNVDHWEVALTSEGELGVFAQRAREQAFPQGALLEAVVDYVGAELE